jgi:breast cancer 2 susceptibility protein
LGYADRLEQKCRGRLSGDEPPDNIDSLYDELEEPDDAGQTIARSSANEAGWLAKYIRERVERNQESVRDEIEKELDVRWLSVIGCPCLWANYMSFFLTGHLPT